MSTVKLCLGFEEGGLLLDRSERVGEAQPAPQLRVRLFKLSWTKKQNKTKNDPKAACDHREKRAACSKLKSPNLSKAAAEKSLSFSKAVSSILKQKQLQVRG